MENSISKKEILDFASGIIEEKIKGLESILTELDEGISQESKSSAGDKHETGRAMLHLEQEKNQSILATLQAQKNSLQQIINSGKFMMVSNGAMVEADELILLIGIGLGPVKIRGREVIFISGQASLAKELFGKKTTDFFEFKGRRYCIQSIS